MRILIAWLNRHIMDPLDAVILGPDREPEDRIVTILFIAFFVVLGLIRLA